MSKERDIDELIADARAEEEVAREQAKEIKENSFRSELEEQLKDAFSDSLRARKENKVTIDLNEYLVYKFQERDLEKILNAIVEGFKLSYSKEDLFFSDGDAVKETFKVLYPEAYEAILDDLINAEG